MIYNTLGASGLRVSHLGFGASPLGNEFGSADPDEATRAVHCAIDRGITFFDVAPYYGRGLAEERLGAALLGHRHQVVLATKCGRYDTAHFDFSAKRLHASIDESLRRLRTDYVDLWQAHDIEFVSRPQIVEEALPAMRDVQKQGKCRFVGITGLPLEVLHEVATATPVDTILSYCHYNLLVTDLDDILTPFARDRKIGLINAAPLHMGILTEQGPPDWHPAPAAVKNAGKCMVEACRRRGDDISSVALRFALDHPYVSTTVVGMSTRAEVERNVHTMESGTDAALIGELRALKPAAAL